MIKAVGDHRFDIYKEEETMKLTWLGHACFLLEQDGYQIVTDPYTGVEGYPALEVSAHEVVCSHHHFDHDAVDRVKLLPPAKSPFAVREVETCHDDQGGTLRGTNTIRVFTAGGVSVAHLGDLGHQLTAAQLAAIGPVDAVLVPVGGVYTVDAAGAKAICDAVGAGCVVPMHYRHAPYGLPNVAGVEDFLNLWSTEWVRRLEGPSFDVTKETGGVLVPSFARVES